MRGKRTHVSSSLTASKPALNGRPDDQAALLLGAESARLAAERKYRHIFENSIEGIFQTSPDGHTLTANPALAKMLGFESPAELIAARTNIGEQGYVHPERRAELKRLVEQRGVVQDFEFECYRKDGSIIWMSENVRAVRDASGTLLYYEGTVQDITERKRAEAAIADLLDLEQSARREAEVMYHASVALTQDLGLETVLKTLLSHLGKLVPYDSANVMLSDSETKFVVGALSGYEDFQIEALKRGITLDANENALVRQICDTRRSLLINDTRSEPAWQKLPGAEHVRNWLGVPLVAHGRVIGMYSMDKAEPGVFTQEHVRMAESLAAQATSAIENAQLLEREQRYAAELEQRIAEGETAEAALRESEKKYRDLVETAHDLIWAVDAQGTITFMNQAARKIYGYEPEELIGRPYLDLLSPEERIRQVDVLPELLASGEKYTVGTECEVLDRDGNRHLLLANAVTVFDQQGNAIGTMGTSADITERRRAEAALRDSEQELRLFNQATNDLFWNWDFETGHVSRSIGFERALGYSDQEIDPLIGWWTDRMHPDDRERVITTLQTAISRGDKACFYEYRFRRQDGSYATISDRAYLVRDENGKAFRAMGAMTDITERKQAEEALHESEERYRELFENSKDAIYIHDLDGNYTSVNPAAEELSGFSRDEIIGRNFADFMALENVEQARKNLWRKVNEKGGTLYEAEIINKSGQRVPVEVSSRLIYANGVAVGVQGSARDITEPKRARQAQRNFSRQLIAAQEGERRRIARELHDQIGQMLTALKLNAHAIQDAGEAQEAWRLIQDNLAMLDEALDQVRDLSIDLRPLLLDDFGLATALHWYVDRQAQRTGVPAEFTVESLDSDLRFAAELETACFRIAQEALTNVARHAQAKSVTVRLSRDEQHLKLLIKDDGVGFDLEPLRGHTNASATLGLRGMEERAQAVGGRVRIESTRDKGTQVFAELPITVAVEN